MAGSINTDVDELISILRGKGTASVDELAGELGVQPKLIENWLYALEDNGKVIVRHRLMRTYAEWVGGGESATANVTAPRFGGVAPKPAREDERTDIRKSVRDEVLKPRELEQTRPAQKREEREERQKPEEKKTKKDEIAEKKMREMEKRRERQERLGEMAKAKLEEIEMLKSARGELGAEMEGLMAQLEEADGIYEELEKKRDKVIKMRESVLRLPKIIREAEAGVEELRNAEESIGGDYAEIGHSLEEKIYDISRIRELSGGKIEDAKRTLLAEVDRLEELETGLRSLNEIRERALSGIEEIRGSMKEGLEKAEQAQAEIKRAEEIDASINDGAGELRRAVRSALSGIMRIDESIKGIDEAEEKLSEMQARFDERRGGLARGIMEAEERLEEMKEMESGIMGDYVPELERMGAESGKGIGDIRKRERELAEKLRAAKKELDRMMKEMGSSKTGSLAGAVFEKED